MKAILRNIRISPKKANLVSGLVRGINVNDALNQLKLTPKKGAKILYKVIDSAASNAENNLKQNREKLYIKEIVVTKGPTYKRSLPVSRGRSHPILKRTAQIRVMLDVKTGAPADAPTKKVPLQKVPSKKEPSPSKSSKS